MYNNNNMYIGKLFVFNIDFFRSLTHEFVVHIYIYIQWRTYEGGFRI
jgi:hypothetical protein